MKQIFNKLTIYLHFTYMLIGLWFQWRCNTDNISKEISQDRFHFQIKREENFSILTH